MIINSLSAVVPKVAQNGNARVRCSMIAIKNMLNEKKIVLSAKRTKTFGTFFCNSAVADNASKVWPPPKGRLRLSLQHTVPWSNRSRRQLATAGLIKWMIYPFDPFFLRVLITRDGWWTAMRYAQIIIIQKITDLSSLHYWFGSYWFPLSN